MFWYDWLELYSITQYPASLYLEWDYFFYIIQKSIQATVVISLLVKFPVCSASVLQTYQMEKLLVSNCFNIFWNDLLIPSLDIKYNFSVHLYRQMNNAIRGTYRTTASSSISTIRQYLMTSHF